MISRLRQDMESKARWYKRPPGARSVVRMLFSDGSTAQVLYRAMEFCQTHHLQILAFLLYRMNVHIGHATIGRGAKLGPGLVILHSMGIVINTRVQAGNNLVLEHGVTIGAEKDLVPTIGDDVFIGAGATIIGDVRIGSGAKIAANSLVIKDVPGGATVMGVPARIIQLREDEPLEDSLSLPRLAPEQLPARG